MAKESSQKYKRMKIELKNGRKAYFVSDAHFGLPSHGKSLEREKLMVKWLDETKVDAEVYFLVGDIFDFWWEYKRSVPKGFTRILGKLAEIVDAGTPVHMFWGNHDMWCRYGYFAQEIGAIVHEDEFVVELGGKRFFLHHGDGLGDQDPGYDLLKWGFRNKFLQWCYSQLHPDFGQWIGKSWSFNRKHSQHGVNPFWGENEFLVKHAHKMLAKEHYDYFIHGHRHTPIVYPLSDKSFYVNTGDWLELFTYGVFDGENFKLLNYPEKEDYRDYSLQFLER